MTQMRLHRGVTYVRLATPFEFWFLSTPFYFDSRMSSLPPYVHDFPHLDNAFSIVRFSKIAILRPDRRGFSLHTVTSASLAPSRQYYSWICHPPSQLASGITVGKLAFCCRQQRSTTGQVGLPWVRRTTSPYSVRLHVSSVFPDIRSRLFSSARPPPQHHLAGSLFATYTGSASCFLPAHRYQWNPCLVGVVLPSGRRRTISVPASSLERRRLRHARHTSGRRQPIDCPLPTERYVPARYTAPRLVTDPKTIRTERMRACGRAETSVHVP